MAAESAESALELELVGRDDELSRIWQLLDRLASGPGPGGTLLVDGPAGVGKSALLRHVAGRVRSGDTDLEEVTVCSVVGAESERDWPYSGLHLVLSSIAGSLEEFRDDVVTSIHGLLGTVNENMSSYDVALRVQALIGSLARPTLVLVDDAHLLDERSQQVLGFVARRIRPMPVVIVLAGDVSAHGAAFQTLPTMYLNELPASDAVRLVRHAGEPYTVGRVAQRVVDRAGGNPGVLLDVVRRIPEGQLAGRSELDRYLPRSAVLQALVLPELPDLDESRRLALLTAATSEDGQLAPVMHALDGTGAEAVASLLDTYLVEFDGSFAFRHPAVGSVIWQESTHSERAAAHRALAAAYEGKDRDWQLWHRAHLRYDEDDELAAQLERASNAFLLRGDVERALAFARESVRLTSATAARVDRLVLAGRLALFGGWADDVVRVARERFRLDTTVEQRADLALLEARARNLLDGDVATGLITRHVEEIARVDPNRAARLNLVAAVGFACRMEHAEAARFLALADRHRDYLDDLTRAVHAGIMALVSGHFDGAADAVAGWPESADAFTAAEGRLCLALALCRAERFDEARQLLRSTLDGLAGKSPLVQGSVHAVATMLEARAGRLSAARLAASAWEESGVGGVWRAVVPAHMIRVHGLLGEEGLAWESYRRSAERARRNSDSWVTAVGHSEAGSLLLLLGRLDDACPVLERARRYALEYADPSTLGAEPDYIEACIRSGELARAESVMADFEQRVRKTPTVWAEHTVARCRALLSQGDESIELFQQAVEVHTETVSPVELARTMLCFGERARRLGRRTDAATWLQRAIVVSEDCGAVLIVTRAEEELRAAGRRALFDAVPTNQLTEAEQRVAALVAAGRRNREIAAELFVSVRTVEAHLGRIFRKVGVRSRTELTAALAVTDDT